MIKNLTSTFRMATFSDARTIARIHIYSWQKMYKEFVPAVILKNFSLDERTQFWLDLIQQGVKVILIEVEKKAVGFASICTFRDTNATQGDGEISAIYLHPQFWRMGLGSKLCLTALTELKRLGYQKVFLWVLEANSQARKFYEALGFEATNSSKLEEFYEGGALLKEILYKKTL